MDKNDESDLNEILDEISGFNEEFIQSSQRILKAGNNKIYTLDLFATTVNNRACSLSKAYVTLARENNYISATSLIRLQLDNALRFFASTLVSDSNDFVMKFIDGEAIGDYKDFRGKNLTDNYLAKQLEKHFPGTLKLYKDACGYIHLSDKHFFPTISNLGNKKRTLEISIGNFENFRNDEKIDFSITMLEVSKLVIIMLEQWKHEKEKLSKESEPKPSLF